MKRALIVGASSQAGYYLWKLLEQKGYQVIGTLKNGMSNYYDSKKTLCHLPRINIQLNLLEKTSETWQSFGSALHGFEIDEVYNLASRMYAPDSWESPDEYMVVNGIAPMVLLDVIRKVGPQVKYFQAGSAEVFDKAWQVQDEHTPRKASSPYALSKIVAEDTVKMYRSKYGLFACTGILFNMESPRRAKSFFAEKVIHEVAKAKLEFDRTGRRQKIKFGDLSAKRDWGLTAEYVEAMWLMLQQDQPRDFVIGTGVSRSCMSYVTEAIKAVGLDASNVEIEASYSSETLDVMHAFPVLIKEELGWEAKSKFERVVRSLVADIGGFDEQGKKEEVSTNDQVSR